MQKPPRVTCGAPASSSRWKAAGAIHHSLPNLMKTKTPYISYIDAVEERLVHITPCSLLISQLHQPSPGDRYPSSTSDPQRHTYPPIYTSSTPRTRIRLCVLPDRLYNTLGVMASCRYCSYTSRFYTSGRSIDGGGPACLLQYVRRARTRVCGQYKALRT
jgi:hypothetical protein